jgi:hypothetical protein
MGRTPDSSYTSKNWWGCDVERKKNGIQLYDKKTGNAGMILASANAIEIKKYTT